MPDAPGSPLTPTQTEILKAQSEAQQIFDETGFWPDQIRLIRPRPFKPRLEDRHQPLPPDFVGYDVVVVSTPRIWYG